VPPATLVLTNGKVVTVETSPAEARAIAITGDRITALGSDDEIKKYVGAGTEVIDVGGQLVIPGFIESHGHFSGVGEAQLVLKLATANTWDDILAMVETAAKAAKPGQWIYGRGWHQEKWSTPPAPNVEGFPTEASLSRVSPNNPVLLTHASGHASFANALAMKLSGVTRTTKNPEGGEILKDAQGNPTGLLRETAAGLIRRGTGEPAPTGEERVARARRVLELAAQEALSKGITSFQDAGTSFETIDRMKAMADEGKLGVRLWVMVRDDNQLLRERLPAYRLDGFGNGFLTVRAIKRQLDGALGSRGAWMLEPYSDEPSTSGLNTEPVADVEETAHIAI
jgi:predicted amidohydrolase YtcJ